MGNICGKSSSDPDAFSTPGRIVGTTPAQPQRASLPPRVVGGPPRKLGGGNDSAAAAAPSSSAAVEARETGSRGCREQRRLLPKTQGKLGQQLAAQKKQSRQETLNEISQEERRARDAEQAAQARAHN
ncbi:hypothetical protein PG993_006789 [Apiospora rasikravindrae]|uniref:Small EDRK-rich factor-like N-terminal domain-containing protein n=1 Tax=Apiospora rasikravindrae TaxID=990691 RepID=A0ABR1T6N6_9PEZI